jgi:hypothetical protein
VTALPYEPPEPPSRRTSPHVPRIPAVAYKIRVSSFSFSSSIGCGGRIHGFRRRSLSNFPPITSPDARYPAIELFPRLARDAAVFAHPLDI